MNSNANVCEISFIFWNITGLKGKLYGITHSSYEFLSYVTQYSIIGIAETWQRKDEILDIHNYTCYKAIREQSRNVGRNSGGVSVYVKNNLARYTSRLHSSSCNIVWIWLQLTKLGIDFDLLVGTTYISPENSSIHSEEDTFDILENELCTHKNMSSATRAIVMGDFNGYTNNELDYVRADDDGDDPLGISNDYDIDDFPRHNMDPRNTNNYGKNLLNFCIASDIYIVNGRLGDDRGKGEYTCYWGDQPSTIDYMLMDFNLFTSCIDFSIDTRYESHHMPLYMKLVFNYKEAQQTCTRVEEAIFLPRFQWQEEKAAVFLEKFNKNNLDIIKECILNGDIEMSVITLTSLIADAAEDMKTNRIRGKNEAFKYKLNEPWYDLECRNERKITIRALKEFRKCRCNENLSLFKASQKHLNALYMKKKKLYQASEKEKLLTMVNDKNSKRFWSYVRGVCSSGGNFNRIPRQQWYDHFYDLFNSFGGDNLAYEFDQDYCVTDGYVDSEIRDLEIIAAVKRLKKNKAPGIDGIVAEFFKLLLPQIKDCLTLLFNKMFRDKFFPVVWGTSLLIPIHKKGSVESPDNYRGIALLPLFSKIFVNIIHNRLNEWVERNNVICIEQGGFRKNFSTSDSIFVLNACIEKYLRKTRGRFYCAFVDFTKAFDSINRNALWLKLQKIGVPANMIKMVMAIYRNLEARVLTSNGYTRPFQCPRGVKQGCVLSPLLFCLYLNDLPRFFDEKGIRKVSLSTSEIAMLLYADDLVLLSESAIGLQRQLNVLKDYCELWQLKVNEAKTKVMVFRKGGALRKYEKWFYGSMRLEPVTYFSYLGVYFSSAHSWSYNQKFRASKGIKALGMTNKLIYKLPNVNSNVLWKIFDVKIKPVLHYGSEIWGNIEAPDIERVHTKFCKRILRINTRVPETAVRGEMGRYPLKCNRLFSLVNFWLRIIRMDESRVTKAAYIMQLQWVDHAQQGWLTGIRNILLSFGFGEVWFNQGPGDFKLFKNVFRQRCADIGFQEWEAKVHSMNRLRFYSVYKKGLQRELYIDKLDPKMRSLVANLRCTGLPFNVIIGVYYNKLDYDTCYCTICNGYHIENEYHFLMECKTLLVVRKKYFAEYYWRNPSYSKFINLMQRTDTYCLIKIAKYTEEALTLRKTHLET